MFRSVLALALMAVAVTPLAAQQSRDINRIIDEGMNRSQVMQTAQHLTDQIGGRLTNSPAMREAEQYTMDRFRDWGLSNIRRDGFEFGRGWSINDFSVTMVSPRPYSLTAIPVAWTPGTNGALRAEIVVAPMRRPADFEAYRGQLAGKIVLVSLPGEGDEPDTPAFRRFTAEEIAERDRFRQPVYDREDEDRFFERRLFRAQMDEFLAAEGALAWVRMSYRDGMLVHGEGYEFRVGQTPALPGVEVAAEDYRRLARLALTGPAPVLELDLDVQFHDDDTRAYNIIAEIPGTDSGAGYVMAGAHLDSWIAADGASDNGAGSAAVMEAARILRSLNIRPRRTIRFVLWSGEEQGILGSLAYTERYLASRPLPPEGRNSLAYNGRWRERFPITRQPGYGDLAAYFNIDNGSGRIRGIHAEGNLGAAAILREWMAPFAGLGATTVVTGPTGGTDHVFMQSVGIPGFQFIQDPLDYNSRIHHTNADTYDHLRPEDLRQASVVLAGMLYQAATSDQRLPAMPIVTDPVQTDPFGYDYPTE